MGDAGQGDDAKALGAAMEVLAKACTDKGLFLLSSAGGKIAVLAVVPKSLSDLSAKAWTDKVLQAIGGKGGGKVDRAQGQASDTSNCFGDAGHQSQSSTPCLMRTSRGRGHQGCST